MFRNILVPATGTPADTAVFATALQAAQPFGGHLEFLHVRVDTTEVLMSMTAGGIGGGDAVQSVIDRMEATATAQEATARSGFEAFCKASGIADRDAPAPAGAAAQVTAEFGVQIGSLSQWVAQYGRFADLVVMGRGEPDDGTAEALEAALMDTGKPLLIAPRQAGANLGGVVIIAWKDTPEAARAVSCALPFIGRASRVVIASVADDAESHDPSGARLQRALRWHNPATEFRPLLSGGRGPLAVLHEEAAALGADLLVMGGYSHSRLREVVFGGFTRTTLAEASLPVLMAH